MAAAGFRPLIYIAVLLALASCAPSVRYVPTPVSSDVAQVSIESATWHVASIRGRPTPASTDYWMSFDRGAFSAKFGCNHFGGHYRINEGVVVTIDVISTVMGCPDPARTFEQLGGAIIALPMQIGMDPATRGPVLFNAGGRIDLVPIVTVEAI